MNILPSLDFPQSRTTLTVQEIAEKLSCTTTHIIHLVEDGSLQALDLKGPGAKRVTYRIPLEAYRAFIAARLGMSP